MDIPNLDWRVQTRAVEQINTPPRMLQDLVFKVRHPNETDTIDVDIIKGGKKLAPFVTDLEGGKIVTGTTRESRSVKTPRIRLKEPMPAKKLLGERGVGQTYYAGGIADVNQAMNQKIAWENRELKNQILTREEWMCAQALGGKIVVIQDNVAFQVDYLMPPSHKIVLAGDDKWTAEAGDPLANVQSWSDTIVKALGFGPDIMICGTNAAAALRKKIAKDGWFDSRRVSAGSFDWNMTSNYMGDLGGISVYRYGSAYEDGAGVDQNLIDPNKIYLVATQARFSIEFGIILDLDAGATVVGEYFAKNWMTKDPSVLWNLIESRPLPVMWQPEAVVEAEVL
jgi:hypothetical protein